MCEGKETANCRGRKGQTRPRKHEEARLVFRNRLAVSLTGTISTKATDCSNLSQLRVFRIMGLYYNKYIFHINKKHSPTREAVLS